MGCKKSCSASGMFVHNNVLSFVEIWRRKIYGFKQRITMVPNNIMCYVYNGSLRTPNLLGRSGTRFYI